MNLYPNNTIQYFQKNNKYDSMTTEQIQNLSVRERLAAKAYLEKQRFLPDYKEYQHIDNQELPRHGGNWEFFNFNSLKLMFYCIRNFRKFRSQYTELRERTEQLENELEGIKLHLQFMPGSVEMQNTQKRFEKSLLS